MTLEDKKLKIEDHSTIFSSEIYQAQFERKLQFESPCADEEVSRVREWSRTDEYREANFAREALVINPERACQPLGAVLAALGFERTLPLVHGSQGCVAYFRTHFSRHFREPVPAVSSSMTEEAAVFGGLSNLVDALENCTALYEPSMVAISTTCMAEVIGDDIQNYVVKAREANAIEESLPVPTAHTPSFVGSHLNGYDSMLKSILSELVSSDELGHPSGKGKIDSGSGVRINVVPGFDTYVGNLREIKRLLKIIGADYSMIGDHSDTLDAPATGSYVMYPGGTSLSDARGAAKSKATVMLQETSTRQTAKMIGSQWNQEVVVLPTPIGVNNTDRFVSEVARLTGRPIPTEISQERGRLVDAMTDSYAYLHGKRVALAGDPDLVVSLLGFLLELGMQPVHVLSSNGDESFVSRAKEALSASPFGENAKVWSNHDLWHMRSLVFSEPVDLLIGSSHLKYISREANVPLVRVGFPIFDRHHLHRSAIVGYSGGINLLTQIVNTILDEIDRAAPEFGFDLVR